MWCPISHLSPDLILNDLFAEMRISIFFQSLGIPDPFEWISDAMYNMKLDKDMFPNDLTTFLSWQALCRVTVQDDVDMTPNYGDVDEELRNRKLLPLSDEQESKFDYAMENIAYKEELTGFCQLKGKDYFTLLPGEWLNDEVMNAYINMLQDRNISRCQKDANHVSVFFHNTFFFSKLAYWNKSQVEQYTYAAVQRWTMPRKIRARGLPVQTMFECDLLIVPVHVGKVHWLCCCVDFMKFQVGYYDSLSPSKYRKLVFRNMMRYLRDEWRDKMPGADADWLDDDKWKSVYDPDYADSQKNGLDCGVFTLKCADWLSDGLIPDFSQEDIPYFRRRIGVEILEGKLLD